MYLVVCQLLAVFCNYIYNCVFIKQTLRQRVYTPVLALSIVFSSQVGIYGLENISYKFSNFGVIAIFLAFIMAQNLMLSQNVNKEIFEQMTLKVEE